MAPARKKHVYIAYLLGHAFVVYVERSQGKTWRRVASDWRKLEAKALEAIENTQGFPGNRYYFCPPDVIAHSMEFYQSRDKHRTLWKKAKEGRGIYLSKAAKDVFILRPDCLGGKSHHYIHEWPENWRELQEQVKAVFAALPDAIKGKELIPCPPELAARAIWKEEKGEPRV